MSDYARDIDLGDGRSVHIRPVRSLSESEVGHVTDLYHATSPDDLIFLPENLTRDDVMRRFEVTLEEGGGLTILAEHDGRVIGHAVVRRLEAEWLKHVGEVDLVVHPAFRGKGIGQALAKAVLTLGASAGFEKLSVDIAVEQSRAVTMFEQLGFEREGLRRKHAKDRDGKPHDLILMGRDI